ncbi:unnamed protein product [Rotaria sp. Silwood1]|nr:unnamed protein product [Rotaria sp. Silwood1]
MHASQKFQGAKPPRIPTRSGIVQQPTQVAPIKRLANNTPVTKTRASTIVKSQSAYNIPRTSTVTVTAPVVSQMKKSISEQDLVNVVPRTQKSRFGFVKKSVDLAAVREDPPHVSPVKPAASSRISGAWKKNGDDLVDERDRRELILTQNELLQIVFTNQLFNEIIQSNRQLQTARFGKLHRAAYRIINDINNLQETRKKAVVDKIVGNIIKTLGETLSKIVRLFNDYDQKQQTLDICLSNKLDRLHIQSVVNDITDENKENWNRTCDRLIELIEANELAQMNTMDLETYSKLIHELDSTIDSYKHTISNYKHVISASEKAMLQFNNNITSKRFRSENSSIHYHSTLSDNLLSCPFCTFNTNSQVDFDFHNHIHHQHICSQCLHVFPNYFLLDLHMDEVHNTYSRIRSYRCLIESCSKIFSNIEQRFQHINDEHHSTKNRHLNDIFILFSNQKMNEMKNKEQDKKFGCDSQKTFIRNSRLRPRQFIDMNWDGDE